MKFFKSFLTAETALLLGAFITAFLPRAILPFALLLTGGGYLVYIFVRATKSHILPDAHFGSASAATVCLLFGICLFFIPDQFITAAVVTAALTFIAQIIWTVRKAKSQQSIGDNNESKQQKS